MKMLLSAAAALAVIAAPASAVTLTTIASFNGANGSGPIGGLMADASGTLYGVTGGGGANDKGTVFSVTSGGTLTSLASFNGTNGEQPGSPLVADASGALYGTTFLGGASGNNGTVFKLSGGIITTLASFNGSGSNTPANRNGAQPYGNLVLDASGTLYGTTNFGSAAARNRQAGTVFSLPSSGGTLTTLTSFAFTNGAEPTSGLFSDAAGNLYGTTSTGGTSRTPNLPGAGTVFSITKTGTLTTLHNFEYADMDGTPGINGGTPDLSTLVLDASGTIYGTTQFGGEFGKGVVFSLANNGTFTRLHSFASASGAPSGALIRDASGTLFGTTVNSVYSLTSGGVFSTLATIGGEVIGNLYQDSSGKIYGTTMTGGDFGKGSVFSLDTGVVPEPASWAMLIAGFGLTGAVMRRRRVTAAIA